MKVYVKDFGDGQFHIFTKYGAGPRYKSVACFTTNSMIVYGTQLYQTAAVVTADGSVNNGTSWCSDHLMRVENSNMIVSQKDSNNQT